MRSPAIRYVDGAEDITTHRKTCIVCGMQERERTSRTTNPRISYPRSLICPALPLGNLVGVFGEEGPPEASASQGTDFGISDAVIGLWGGHAKSGGI